MKTNRWLLLAFLPLLALLSCGRNNIHEKENWGDIFKEYGIENACMEVYDNTHDQVFVYNIPRMSDSLSPASTFKILNSLIALEINLAPDLEYTIAWDGEKRWNENWNQDLTMQQAFTYSAVPYYQELARRIGKDTMQHYLDTVRYGNKNMGGTVDQFWLDGSLLISSDEQVGFLKRLYFDKLPFSDRAQRLTRKLMLAEENEEYKLYYKTGTMPLGDKYIVHLVGFIEKIEVQEKVQTDEIETNYRPYFFAMNYETKDKEVDFEQLKKERVEIAKRIFKELEIIK